MSGCTNDDRGHFRKAKHTVGIDNKGDFCDEQYAAQDLQKGVRGPDGFRKALLAYQGPDDGHDQVKPVAHHHDEPDGMIDHEQFGNGIVHRENDGSQNGKEDTQISRRTDHRHERSLCWSWVLFKQENRSNALGL